MLRLNPEGISINLKTMSRSIHQRVSANHHLPNTIHHPSLINKSVRLQDKMVKK